MMNVSSSSSFHTIHHHQEVVVSLLVHVRIRKRRIPILLLLLLVTILPSILTCVITTTTTTSATTIRKPMLVVSAETIIIRRMIIPTATMRMTLYHCNNSLGRITDRRMHYHYYHNQQQQKQLQQQQLQKLQQQQQQQQQLKLFISSSSFSIVSYFVPKKSRTNFVVVTTSLRGGGSSGSESSNADDNDDNDENDTNNNSNNNENNTNNNTNSNDDDNDYYDNPIDLSSSSSSSSSMYELNPYYEEYDDDDDGDDNNNNKNNNDIENLWDNENDTNDTERNDEPDDDDTKNNSMDTKVNKNNKNDTKPSLSISSDGDHTTTTTTAKSRKEILTTKRTISKLLRENSKLPQNSIGNVIIKKYRWYIVLGIILYMYPQQITKLFLSLITVPIIDKNGTKIIGSAIDLTSIIKLLLFLDILRRFITIQKQQQQQQSNTNTTVTTQATTNTIDDVDDDEYSSSNELLSSILPTILFTAFSGGGGGGGFAGGGNSIGILLFILSKLLTLSGGKERILYRNAYVPTIEQHYTFERINERYTIDDYAYQKVLGRQLPTIQSSSSASSPSTTTTSTTGTTPPLPQRFTLQQFIYNAAIKNQLQRQQLLVQQRTTTNKKDYNGTAIVLDWTNLDTTVQSQDILRDKVSFIIHQYNKYYRTDETTTVEQPARKEDVVSELSKDENTSSESNADASSEATEDASSAESSVERTKLSTPQPAPSLLPSSLSLTFEVVILLESPGGSAADYALVASHLRRLRMVGIQVTVCVDKVAASGGYMVACLASPGQLYAAPFAVLGSIGVIGQTINIQKSLERWGIHPMVFRGGKNKAPLGLLGNITQDGIDTIQKMIDETHVAFKDHVAQARPIIAEHIDDIGTGDIWLGSNAIKVGLIDRVITSDEYIQERIYQDNARIVKLVQVIRPKYPFFGKPTTGSSITSSSVFGSILSQIRLVLQLITSTLNPNNHYYQQ